MLVCPFRGAVGGLQCVHFIYTKIPRHWGYLPYHRGYLAANDRRTQTGDGHKSHLHVNAFVKASLDVAWLFSAHVFSTHRTTLCVTGTLTLSRCRCPLSCDVITPTTMDDSVHHELTQTVMTSFSPPPISSESIWFTMLFLFRFIALPFIFIT